MSYRKLKLTEYINSSNIIIIYRFIKNQLERLGQLPSDFPEEQEFEKDEYARQLAMNKLIAAMNKVEINSNNDDELTESKDLFDEDTKIQFNFSEETIIDENLGQKIIENAKTLFGVKVLIRD